MRAQRQVRIATGDPDGSWNWPPRKRPDHVAEYEAAEKSQDQKDFLTACLILGPAVLMIGLGVSQFVEIVAGWIA